MKNKLSRPIATDPYNRSVHYLLNKYGENVPSHEYIEDSNDKLMRLLVQQYYLGQAPKKELAALWDRLTDDV